MPVPLWWRCVCRGYQAVLFYSSLVLPWPRPHMLKGAGAVALLPKITKERSLRSALLVTDASIVRLGMLDGLLKGLAEAGTEVTVYKDVTPNPTVDQIEEALALYNKNNCDHLIAVGGGSPIDCAKAVGARHVRPRTSVAGMRGLFRVLWKIPPMFAVPTTAGTGSEATIAAVVTDSRTHEKYAMSDMALLPTYAVLDPQLTVGLPKFFTATTGMDALTHAVEAFTNKRNVHQTERDALLAVRLIFGNLKEAYDHGDNIVPRERMQEAAYHAGLAFTRAYVGNVHAAAHQLGGFYDVPHGLANAVILPVVLDIYGHIMYHRLAILADEAGIEGATDEERATRFIQAIRDLNKYMNIPTRFSEGEKPYYIKEEDIPEMVRRALGEANPVYPVPVIFGEEEMCQVYRTVM